MVNSRTGDEGCRFEGLCSRRSLLPATPGRLRSAPAGWIDPGGINLAGISFLFVLLATSSSSLCIGLGTLRGSDTYPRHSYPQKENKNGDQVYVLVISMQKTRLRDQQRETWRRAIRVSLQEQTRCAMATPQQY
jgi:hypothetical protein